ncbi:MAG: hypothetical protein Q9162_002128 [Coniocarpon cinnabarinum]
MPTPTIASSYREPDEENQLGLVRATPQYVPYEDHDEPARTAQDEPYRDDDTATTNENATDTEPQLTQQSHPKRDRYAQQFTDTRVTGHCFQGNSAHEGGSTFNTALAAGDTCWSKMSARFCNIITVGVIGGLVIAFYIFMRALNRQSDVAQHLV